MKQFLGVLTICAFMLNAFTASALALSCTSHSPDPVQQAEHTVQHETGMETMPCHSTDHKKQKSNSSDHCENMCMCFYTCTSQIPVMNESSFVPVPDYVQAEWTISNDQFSTRTNAPPKRPPKTHS